MLKEIKNIAIGSYIRIENFYYKIINRNSSKILIYTDSRGLNVEKKLKRIPHNTYISMLRKKYFIDYAICPEKYTTIIDFLIFTKKYDLEKYDAIVLHCGVVDFSPRPLTNLENFKASKISNFYFLETFAENSNYYNSPFNIVYKGEKTINLYSTKYLANKIIPELQKIPNLIWINSNRFVKGWEGNYKKGRPGNIDEVVNSFDTEMAKFLKNIIDLKHWDSENVQINTIDNIHFTKAGFKVVYTLLDNKIQEIICNNSTRNA